MAFHQAMKLLLKDPSAENREELWSCLGSLSVKKGLSAIAEYCFAILGDWSKTHFLRRLRKKEATDGTSKSAILSGWVVCTSCKPAAEQRVSSVDALRRTLFRLLAAEGNLKRAETVLLEDGKFDAAVEMYRSLDR